MKAKVIAWLPDQDYHKCVDEDGNLLRVDILVDGGLPADTNPADLVGKTVEWAYTHAYIAIAHGVRLTTHPKD